MVNSEQMKAGTERHGGWNFAQKDFAEKDDCFSCKKPFTLVVRRHHCRYCKNSFCGDCSPHTTAIPEHEQNKQVRVCHSCRDIVKGTRINHIPDDDTGEDYDYDLFVIGGGSGGLACAKEAAKFNMKVAVADFVPPSPTYPHTSWGLGGTCVNVGCIPKKLMHTAGLLGEGMEDARYYGWDVQKGDHSWKDLVSGVQKHIVGLNKGYEADLPEKKVDYFNLFAKFKNKEDNHEIFMTDGNKTNPKEVTKRARRIVIAVGGRPRLPDIPGAAECCITSDDIFALKENPGKKVLVIGASYVALECAGFLTAFGHDVTVMVRSILLRGFDQEMADKIGQYMKKQGTKFLRGKVPVRMERGEKKEGRIEVTYTDKDATEEDDEDREETDFFDTVLCAIGRNPCTRRLGLCCAGVMRNVKAKIPVFQEQTNVPHIYAIGDVATLSGDHEALELTPVAIQAGKLLARRLFNGSTKQMNYDLVPTTIFTPLEYGCCGLTEEAARQKLGDDNVEAYHQIFQPLEMTLPERMNKVKEDHCFTKLVLDLSDGKVIGFHYLGPNAGEVTQGFALAMKLGATKAHFDDVVGIHPTNAENLTTLDISKGSGLSAEKEDC